MRLPISPPPRPDRLFYTMFITDSRKTARFKGRFIETAVKPSILIDGYKSEGFVIYSVLKIFQRKYCFFDIVI